MLSQITNQICVLKEKVEKNDQKYLKPFYQLIRKTSSYSIKEITLENVKYLKVNENYNKFIARYRKNIIKYAKNKEKGFNKESDRISRLTGRISLFLVLMIQYPRARKGYNDELRKITTMINLDTMENSLIDYWINYEKEIDIEKVKKVKWKKYLHKATKLPKKERYKYLYTVIMKELNK